MRPNKKKIEKYTQELIGYLSVVKNSVKVNNMELAKSYIEDINGITALITEELEKIKD